MDHHQIVRKKAVQLLKIGETKTKEVFNELLDKELIKRKGKGRATFYTLTNN
jgi:ATP-dependent DNA helicase RecG